MQKQTMIRRRRVIYVEGYDPQGAEGYYGLFGYSWKRFLKIWPLKAEVGPLRIDSDDFAHWDIETAGPNWQVSTRYDFLRQEQMIRGNMAEPLIRLVPRAIGWALEYLLTGTIVRVFRASWHYGLALVFFQLGLLLWLTLSVVAGWLAAFVAFRHAGLPHAVSLGAGAVAAVGCFLLLKPLAYRLMIVQINSHWPYLLEYARGNPSCFDAPVEAGARRLVEAARAHAADEIVVVGHSGGGVLGPAVVARALAIDPEVGQHGPKVILLTLGSIMPGAGVHPQASALHNVIRRVAVEPSVLWIDVQSRKDVLNFYDFDPVSGIGVDAGSSRCNPLIWKVRFREMLSPELYGRIRLNFFRMHYQFIMANDRRAAYDYFMLTCGPVPVEDWARNGRDVVERFAPDADYAR